MVSHADSLGSGGGEAANLTRLAERDARIRATYPDEAHARMFDYSVHLRDRVQPIPRDGLRDAAETVLRGLNERLAPLEGQVLEPGPAFEAMYQRLYAVEALTLLTGSRMEAKRIDVALAGGRPLTVCTGPRRTFGVQTLRGETHIPLWFAGCRIVFPDSLNVRGGGRPWKDWCPSCTPGASQPARRLALRHRRAIGS